MVDIHSHILPGIDDGAQTIETSTAILKKAEELGVENIIATPHFIYGKYENDFQSVVKAVEELNKAAEEEGLKIKVFPGQEVFLDKQSDVLYKEGLIKGLNGTDYMLMEFPFDGDPLSALDIIYELKLLGVKPVLAHPERYMEIIRKPELINDFIAEGCLFQINAGSLAGKYGKDVLKLAGVFIQHGIIDFVGSDAHSCNYLLKSEIIESFIKINKAAACAAMENNKAILENGALNINTKENIQSRKAFFKIFG